MTLPSTNALDYLETDDPQQDTEGDSGCCKQCNDTCQKQSYQEKTIGRPDTLHISNTVSVRFRVGYGLHCIYSYGPSPYKCNLNNISVTAVTEIFFCR